ncbi:hypothetical protein EDB89DRAFT_1906168 [Lactarius sanguifluus]|nr:hypothetical protein EDB89DRAFT_1906168 [Lactarius sanguifluus]
MATTNGSSTWWSRSGDNVLSNSTNTPQSNDRVTDRASHRVANGTGLEGGSPYSSSIWRGYGSAVELREHTAGAGSAASSDQLSWVRGPHPAPSRPFAPQTTASKSSHPVADADAEQDARYRADSDLLQPHKDTSRPHDPSAPALSSSKSAGLLAPKGYHITRRGGAIPGLMEPSRSMPLNGRPSASAAASSPASKKIPRPSKLRVTNGSASVEPSQGERARYGYPQAEAGPPHGTNPNRSGSRNVDLPSSAQTLVRQRVHHPPPLKDLPTFGPSAPALSSSKSAGLLAPKGYHITRRSGAIPGLMEPSRSMPLNGRPSASAAASSLASKKIPRPSKLRVTNGGASVEPSQGERARYGYPQAEAGPPHGTNPNRSGSRNVDLPRSANIRAVISAPGTRSDRDIIQTDTGYGIERIPCTSRKTPS